MLIKPDVITFRLSANAGKLHPQTFVLHKIKIIELQSPNQKQQLLPGVSFVSLHVSKGSSTTNTARSSSSVL